MRIGVIHHGGRVVEGNTPFGRFRMEWDASGKLLSESIEIRTPDHPAPPKPAAAGPGDLLKRLIAKVTGEEPSNCSCGEHVAEMNQRGWAWCLANHRTIAQWLQDSALKRAEKLEAAAAEAQARAAKARAAAEAIDPEQSLSLVKAARKEMGHG